MSAFDWQNQKSKIGQELERQAKSRRAMTAWVEKQRAEGKEPCYLALREGEDLKPLAANKRSKT